jgi:dethiobiotin synthetase
VIVAVTGTGTGIGKTYVACAMLRALRERGTRAIGYKPVESGVGTDITDEQLLREASEPLPDGVRTIRLATPLAPNVAARREGVTIDPEAIVAALAVLAARYEVVLLELAGGLFSPLTDDIDNAALLLRLANPKIVVVAPDRLGVLHDVAATVRAARAAPLAIHAIVLSAPAVTDDSTGSNANELARLGIPIASWPRAQPGDARTLVDLMLGA